MADRARHAHGSSANVDAALQAGKIDAFDILFLDADTDKPKIGWISKDGNKIIVNENLDADFATLETEISKKANTEEVEEKIDAAVLSVMDITSAYTDSQIEEKIKEVNNGFEIIEF